MDQIPVEEIKKNNPAVLLLTIAIGWGAAYLIYETTNDYMALNKVAAAIALLAFSLFILFLMGPPKYFKNEPKIIWFIFGLNILQALPSIYFIFIVIIEIFYSI